MCINYTLLKYKTDSTKRPKIDISSVQDIAKKKIDACIM